MLALFRDPNYKYLCISDRDCENYEAQYGQDSGAECCDDFMCGHSCFWSAKKYVYFQLNDVNINSGDHFLHKSFKISSNKLKLP